MSLGAGFRFMNKGHVSSLASSVVGYDLNFEQEPEIEENSKTIKFVTKALYQLL